MTLRSPIDTPWSAATTWLDLLQQQTQPERVLYTFLEYTGTAGAVEHDLTVGELDRRARAVAALIRSQEPAGARVLLLYPPGLEYIVGFFGCLYAGVVAVPLYPPDAARPERTLPRVRAVVGDARASLALTTAAVAAAWSGSPELGSLRLCATDTLTGDGDGRIAEVLPGDLAILQYTSGSTASPRGVMLTHANMLANAAIQRRGWRLGPDSVCVSWLPLYHDLGVLAVLLQPLYSGFRTVLMTPTDFLQRPLRWLEAIARHRGTFAGGPNFAFDLCLRRSTQAERAGLDLSSWSTAFNGAEPVRIETMDAFADAFAVAGFRRQAFYPCYGLAECNFVAGGLEPAGPVVRRFSRSGLERGVVETDDGGRALVGCGRLQPGQVVRLVDSARREICPEGQIGEIWIAGASVGQGYFERQAETDEVFGARLAGHEEQFLRTGDLGFFADGELFIAGRAKDVIIVRGANHHPHDIEATVAGCHPALRPGCGAAFAIDEDGEERLVLALEVAAADDPTGYPAVFAAIRSAVARYHALEVHTIVLLGAGAVFKTTSGKLQRGRCRAAFLAGELASVAVWRWAAAVDGQDVTGRGHGAADIEAWLVAAVAERAGVAAEAIDRAAPFADFGLDSRHIVELSGALEAWLGRRVAATIAYEHPSIVRLARHLAGETAPTRTDARATEQLPIAVIGIGCRFPGAASPEAYWSLLRDGIDAITEVPADRWDATQYYDPDTTISGTTNTRWGGFLADVDRFDPMFFKISPREAEAMDPQQRLLLEVAWEAFEDAGLVPAQLEGSDTGVFVGITTDDYGRMQWRRPEQLTAHSATGTLHCVAANRLSYVFDFHGPSIAVDTACSASLVALHQACESLRRGECSLALAGGVNVILSPENAISQARLGALSPRGRCRPFADGADGIVRGEGAGVVVLKPLAQALVEGDRILAVIRGSAVNQDGRSNGLTAPNARAQEAAVRVAQRRGGVVPSEVEYIEAHGTGTALGDPIEAQALGAVLAEGRREGSRCALGSVKSNIGHLEAAAGVAGLIKVVLALQHEAIPATLHFAAPNPRIPFDSLPLEVPTTLTPWPARTSPRIAGVSGFGIGGTNAHIVLASAPPTRAAVTSPTAPRAEILPLSACSLEALRATVGRHEVWLAENAGLSPRSVCATAALHRTHHDVRLAVVGRTTGDLRERLAVAPIAVTEGSRPRRGRRSIVFVFSGHGSQHAAMARQLLVDEPVFREALTDCARALERHGGSSVLELLRAEDGPPLGDTAAIQQMLFAVAVGLVAVWRAWGVVPDAVVGHSLGEVAAAHVAGILDLEAAARLVCARSRLLTRIRGQGAMAVVNLSMAEAEQAIAGHAGRLAVAAVNAAASTVLSGEVVALDEVVAGFVGRGVSCRAIQADGAGHSPLVEPLRHALVAELAGLVPRAGEVPFFSTVTAGPIPGTTLDAHYWGRNLREPVRFSPTVERLIEAGHDVFLEVSPHAILAPSIRQDLQRREQTALVIGSLRREADDRTALLESLAALYASGHPVDFSRLYARPDVPAPLPTYPWQRERYWLNDAPMAAASPRRVSGSLFDRHIRSARADGPLLWEVDVSRASHRFVADHASGGAVVFPGLASVCLVLAAGGVKGVREVKFLRPIVVPATGGVTLQLSVLAEPSSAARFEIFARPQADDAAAWILHASGILAVVDGHQNPALDEGARAAIAARLPNVLTGDDFYTAMHRAGNHLGPNFQGITRIARGAGEALGEVHRPVALGPDSYLFHPAYLDACAQVLLAACPEIRPFMPVEFEALEVHAAPGDRCWTHARVRESETADCVIGDLQVFAEDGLLLAEIRGARLRHLDRADATPPAEREVPREGLERAALACLDSDLRSRRIEAYLTQQVSEVMRIPATRLDRHRGLDSLGLDSLTAAQIKQRIGADLGVEITMMAFLRGTSVAELATLIAEEVATTPSPAAPAIPTVMLDEAIRPPPGVWVADRPRRMLLTGATGFLGVFVLAQLLRATDAEVHCLVRAGSPALAMARLSRIYEAYGLDPAELTERVVAIPGDLAAPRLGLQPATFDALAGAIDVILHVAAQVSHAAAYAQLEPVNVGGTRELLRLAVTGRIKPIHHVSTLSFFCGPDRGETTVTEVDRPEVAVLAALGAYAQTKWNAEQLVMQARARGVPAAIHRPVLVGWHSRSGTHNPEDFFGALLRGCVALGAAPDLDLVVQMVPVDHLACALVHLATQSTTPGRDYHLSHLRPVSWSRLVELVRSLGLPLQRIDYADWQRRLVAAVASDPTHPLGAYAPLFPPDAWASSALETLATARMPNFDRRNADEALAGSGIVCPEIDGELVAAFLRPLLRSQAPVKNSTSMRATASG